MLCHLVTLNWPKQALKSYLRSPLIKSNNTDHSSLNIWEFEEFLKLNCGLLRRRMKLKIFTLIIIPLILWLTKERFFSHKLVIRRKNFARQQKVFFWPEYFHFGSGSISDIYHHRITTKNHSHYFSSLHSSNWEHSIIYHLDSTVISLDSEYKNISLKIQPCPFIFSEKER